MLNGKGIWNQFAASCKFSKTVRSLGYDRIILNVFSFDREVHEGLSSKLIARHDLQYDAELGLGLGELNHVMSLLEWHIEVADPLHDFQNALRWCVSSISSAAMLKNFYLVVASLRNGYRLLVLRIRTFVVRHIRFDSVCHDLDVVKSFGCDMGVDADLIDHIASIDRHFTGGQLVVSSKAQHVTDYVDLACDSLMYLFKFRLTTESRILTHGPSARSFDCALFFDIEDIVRLTLGEGASSYHLHGFEANLNIQVRTGDMPKLES